jgi:phosphatidylglycerophosphate synthase
VVIPQRRGINQSHIAVTSDWRALTEVVVPNLSDNEGQSSEDEFLAGFARRIPGAISPDHLTYAGLAGAVCVAVGFIASRWSNWFLGLVALGLACNWLSEGLVRAVSERRGAARPLYGYFIDNSADLVAQTLIIMALGFSPYFTVPSALLVLSLYLLLSSYKYLLVVIHGGAQPHGGFEPKGLRLLVMGWSLFAAFMGHELASRRLLTFVALDVIVGALSICAFVMFIFIVRRDLARVRLREQDANDDSDEEFFDDGEVISMLPRLAPARRRSAAQADKEISSAG